jgi:drug/metabolite transporter (DMT)-like permease
MMSKSNWSIQGIALMVGATIIWGSTFAVSKMAMEEIHPITLSALRCVIASVVTVALAVRTNRGYKWNALPWKTLITLGVTGTGLFFVLQNVGLYYTSATSASLVQATIPVFVFILSFLFLKERITMKGLAGTIASVIGAVIIVISGTDSDSGNWPLLGNALVLASALMWAIYTITGKRSSADLPDTIITASSNLFGLLILLPLSIVELANAGQSLSMPSLRAWAAVIHLGLLGSGLAYLLWNKGLKLIPASQAGIYVNLCPVASVVFAGIMLGETITLGQVVGGAMVIAGALVAGGGGDTAGEIDQEKESGKASL